METRVTVTHEQLLAELLRAKREGAKPAGAFRAKELKQVLGWKIDSIREALMELKNAGIVEVVPIRVEVLDGRNQPIPHYRIKDGENIEELVNKMLGTKEVRKDLGQ